MYIPTSPDNYYLETGMGTAYHLAMKPMQAKQTNENKTLARVAMKSQLLSSLLVYYLAYKSLYTDYYTQQVQIILVLYDRNRFFYLQKPCNVQQTNEN